MRATAAREYTVRSASYPHDIAAVALFHDVLAAKSYPFAPQPGAKQLRVENVIVWLQRALPAKYRAEVMEALQRLRK